MSETALSVVELARRAGVTRQTTHRAVTQLVGEGLLVGEPGPGVPRSTLIRLTDAGRGVGMSPWVAFAAWRRNSRSGSGPRRWPGFATP
ncbi:MarR family transcriptional regulator [Actinomadura keratinilytica]